MARDFDGTGDYFLNDSGLVGVDVPQRSVSFIVDVNAIPTWKAILNINADDTNNRCSLSAISPVTSGWALELEVYTNGTDGVWKTGDLSLNVEYSICVIYDGLNEPVVYVDGVDQGALTEVTAPTGIQDTGVNSIVMGANIARTNSLDGQLSEVAIWSRELTDTEAILITSGNSATHVMEGLQHYWPIQDWPYDHINGAELTVTGTTVVASPSINYRYPVIARAATTTGTTNAGSPYNMVVNMPNTRPDGDIYVFHITRNGLSNSIADPSGIQEFRDIADNLTTGPQAVGGSMTYYAGYKRGLSEPASYTFTSDGAGGASQAFICKVIRIVGVDLTTVYGRAVQAREANDTWANANSVEVVSPDSLILRLYSVDTDYVSNVDARDIELYATGHGSAVGHGGGFSLGPVQGSVGNRRADLAAADDWVGITVEMRSAAPVFPVSPPWENFNKVKLVQSKYYTLNAAGTSRAVTFDNPTQEGNTIVTCFTANKNTGTITVPSGFSPMTPINNASVSAGMAHKVADGTETTITWTWASSQTGSSVWVGEFSGLGELIDWDSAESEQHNVDFGGTRWHGNQVDNITDKTRFTLVLHAMDNVMASVGLTNVKFYPEMQVLFHNKISVADEGMIVAVREETTDKHDSFMISHKGDADQIIMFQGMWNVKDKELPQGLYVPNSQLAPQLTMPNKKPIGNVMVDKFHPLAKGMVRAMLFQERAGAVTKDHYTGEACRVDDSCLPWGDAINLSLAGNAVWLGGHNANLGIYTEGSLIFRGRALDTLPNGSDTIFVSINGYTKLCIYRGATNTDLQVCAGTKETGHSVSADIWDGETHEIVFYWDASGNWRYLYIDGVAEVTASTGPVSDVDLRDGFVLGEAGDSGCGWEFDFCYMYNYWLQLIEEQAIWRDPYQMFIPDSNF